MSDKERLNEFIEAEKQEMISKLQLAKQIAIVALEEQYLNQEAQATGSEYPAFSNIPNSTAHIPVIEPTETSILRVSITSVAPIASRIRICALL